MRQLNMAQKLCVGFKEKLHQPHLLSLTFRYTEFKKKLKNNQIKSHKNKVYLL